MPREPGVNIRTVAVINPVAMPARNTTQWTGGNQLANPRLARRLQQMRLNLQRRSQRTLLVLSPEENPRPGAQAAAEVLGYR